MIVCASTVPAHPARHLSALRLHAAEQRKLRAGAVEVVARPRDFIVSIALQVVRQETDVVLEPQQRGHVGENISVDPLQNGTLRLYQRDLKRVVYGSAALVRTVRKGARQLELVADSCELLSGEKGSDRARWWGKQKGAPRPPGERAKHPSLGRRCDHADEAMNHTKAVQLQEAGAGFIKVSGRAVRFRFSEFSVSLINSFGALILSR